MKNENYHEVALIAVRVSLQNLISDDPSSKCWKPPRSNDDYIQNACFYANIASQAYITCINELKNGLDNQNNPSEKKVFYVDVGNVPPNEVEKYIDKVKESMENDIVVGKIEKLAK